MSCTVAGMDVNAVEGADCDQLKTYYNFLIAFGLVTWVCGLVLLLNIYKCKGKDKFGVNIDTWKINMDSQLEFMLFFLSVVGSVVTIVFFSLTAQHSDPFIGLSVLWLILGLFGLTGWFMILQNVPLCATKLAAIRGVKNTGLKSDYRSARFDIA